MRPNLAALRAALTVVATVAVVMVGGCSKPTTPAADPAPSTASSSPTVPQSSVTASPAAVTTANTGTAAATPTGTPTDGAAAAVQSALALFQKVPRNPNDPGAGYVWVPVGDPSGHLSPDVIARLDALRSSGYFGGQVCAEDYLTGTQNGLVAAPTVISVHSDAGGTVTVTLHRSATPAPPDLTVVMTRRADQWRATDLASGNGPSASIFAAKPHC